MPKIKKKLTLSIVIPVYNEEDQLADCLDSIDRQTEAPDEVIVVDNASTDKSAQIARRYPFVRLISEPTPGLIPARNAGFNAAKGDILGRLDADVRLAPTWVHRVKEDFSNNKIDGLTGLGRARVLLGFKNLHTTFWSRIYFWAAEALFGFNIMWGANMAISRSVWLKIRDRVTLIDMAVHEDQDISVFVVGAGGRILKDNTLILDTEGESYLYWPKFWEYFTRFIKTKFNHDRLKTVPPKSPLRLSRGRRLGAAAVALPFTIVFILYAFMTWPIMALMVRLNKIKPSARH